MLEVLEEKVVQQEIKVPLVMPPIQAILEIQVKVAQVALQAMLVLLAILEMLAILATLVIQEVME